MLPHLLCRELELSLWVLQMNPHLLPRYEKMAQESMDELNAREIIKHVQVTVFFEFIYL